MRFEKAARWAKDHPQQWAQELRRRSRSRSEGGRGRAGPQPAAARPNWTTRWWRPSRSWPTCSPSPSQIAGRTEIRRLGRPPLQRRAAAPADQHQLGATCQRQSESPAPPAKFFWFLPTNGDSRSIVGASHASSHHTVPAELPRAHPPVPGRGRPRRRPARLRRGADADRNLVRGRLVDRVGAARRDRAAEVPRRVPARAGAADAGRAADRDAAAVLRGPGAAQHRQRRRRRRAAPVRRLARPRRALRPHRGVPAHRELGVAPGLPRLRGQVLHGQGRAGVRTAGSVAADLLRRIVARGAADRRGVRRRLPDVG